MPSRPRGRSHADETYDERRLADLRPSVAHLFRDRVAADPGRRAFSYFEGQTLAHVTWAQARATVWDWAAGLIALGIRPQERVAIASSTRYEWILADTAIMCAGAATTTVYPSTLAADVGYLLADSGCRLAFAEDAAQVAKLRTRRDELPDLARVICFDDAAAQGDDGDWVLGIGELVRLGRERLAADPRAVDDRIDALGPDDLATIIYTSGTTGKPKGVEITHRAFVYEGAAVAAMGFLDQDDLQFLWLPLSHVFGKTLMAIAFECGCATAVDGRIDKIVEHLAVIRPTWMGAAPRIFEKAKGKVGLAFEQASGPKAALVAWALSVGRQVSAARLAGRTPAPHVRLQHVVADALVLGKVRARFGGRIRFFISGSAALDADVARWFHALGLTVLEGYGLTETTGPCTVNRPWDGSYAFGTIGWPLPGTLARVDCDGELLVKGPGVMRGYHGHPDATTEVMTQDGYFRTGDIAAIDERGFIRITDRKKDVFKTSGGKYIAPSHIAARFVGMCPYASQFVVIGEGKNYASALVTLDAEAIGGWAAAHGLGGASYAEIAGSDAARDLVAGYVERLNAGLNRWETIKRFAILERELSIADGELTPSLKLKRNVTVRNFDNKVRELYPPS